VPVGALVYRFERVRLADGVAVSFDETWLPLDLGQAIAGHDLAVEPIFSLLEDRYGLALVEAEYRLQAVIADARVAAALAVAPGSAIFRIDRTSSCAGRGPVDHETLYYRGDLIQFVTRLSRRAPAVAQ
jgi:GntR family transcriptional regulator